MMKPYEAELFKYFNNTLQVLELYLQISFMNYVGKIIQTIH